MTPDDAGTGTLHASCVADRGRGLLILGPSGSGKSALALALIGLGAVLVADDQVILRRDGDKLIATCPPALAGLIEARGIGILRAPVVGHAPVALVVDLGIVEADRLPPCRQRDLLGVSVDLVTGPVTPHFAVTLLHLLRHGRAA